MEYLSFFDFEEFTPAFLLEMKQDIPELLRRLAKEIGMDWESLPAAVLYHERVLSRARLARQTAVVMEIDRGAHHAICRIYFINLAREKYHLQ